MKPVILVAGPTAAGKSALSLFLAKNLRGEIVSLDSVQIFRGCNIGSSKLPVSDLDGIKHHLIDIIDPDDEWNVSEFKRLADNALKNINEHGKQPIVVGGTTMYISVLFHGLAALPGEDKELRVRLEKLSPAQLFDELKRVDPEISNKLHINDRLRIIRAIESSYQLGKPASSILATHGFRKNDHVGLFLVIIWPRDEIRRRIEERARQMFAEGLISETEAVFKQYGDGVAPLRTLGYSQVLDYLKGKISKDEALVRVVHETRQYAKRQETFWRNEPGKRCWNVFPKGIDDNHASMIYSGQKALGSQERKFFLAYQFDKETLLANVTQRLSRPFATNEVWYLSGPCLKV